MLPLCSLLFLVVLTVTRFRCCYATESYVDVLNEILTNPMSVNLTLVPYKCDFQKVSNHGAFTLTSFETFAKARYPSRVLIVFCQIDAKFISIWEYLYVKYIRLYKPRYFSVLDFTLGEKRFDFSSSEVVAGPFSYLRFVPKRNIYELFVDSDFRGARKAWSLFRIPREDVQENKVPLFELMIYQSHVHDGPMRMIMTFKRKDLRVDMIPKYPTNYSKPGEIVYTAQEGVARSSVKTHFPTFVPLLLDDHVAIYLNPKVVNSNYILLLPFHPMVWLTIFSFSVAIALIMTGSLPKPKGIPMLLFLVHNVIFTFCQMFTTVQLPSASKFLYNSAAITSVFWTLLCMIPLTGYRSTLASLLQTPPREARHTSANLFWKFEDKLVGRVRPNISTFLDELRQGDFWVEGSRSINFLLSQWGLRKATYTAPIDPPTLEMYSFQCLQRRAQNLIYACRSTQSLMRVLFDNNVIMPWLNQIQRDHIRNTGHTVGGVASKHRDRRIEVQGPLYRDIDGNEIVALKLQIVQPFFTLLALGFSLALVAFLAEFTVDTVGKSAVIPNRDRRVRLPRQTASFRRVRIPNSAPQPVRFAGATVTVTHGSGSRIVHDIAE